MANLTCFKAYDVRGQVPTELNPDLANRIGQAYAAFLRPKKVVVGRDIRLSSEELAGALIEGLTTAGCDVLDIGICGTEQVYFSTFHLKADGGIMVTASHNPKDYNGLKFVREEARPISSDTGLKEIEALAFAQEFTPASRAGNVKHVETLDSYVDHLLGYVDRKALKPLKIVTDTGNGCAGQIIDALAPHLPVEFIRLRHNPDGNFPHGVPNPLLEENRTLAIKAIKEHQADLAIAWDGDFDRCFLFDETGRFIDGYYIVGLLAEALLAKNPGGKVIHDPRLVWNTIEMVEAVGGIPVMTKSGHAFIKERMREEDAIYGGEMSAHHYFKEFSYCDSGMIPWLLVIETLARTGKPLSALVEERMNRFPISGEINRRLDDADAAVAAIEERYRGQEISLDRTDGLSMEFVDWRFNLRQSNTEPLLRLNVETRQSQKLLKEKTEELLEMMK